MREKTGSIPIEDIAHPPVSREALSEYPRYRYSRDRPPSNGLSKDMWVKLITWVTPIIFAAGALYYSIGSMTERVKDAEASVSTVKEIQNGVRSEQRVLSVQMQAIRENQAEVDAKLDKVVEKMDAQKDDLSAIKAKLGIRRRSR